jgi:hypothetical protein
MFATERMHEAQKLTFHGEAGAKVVPLPGLWVKQYRHTRFYGFLPNQTNLTMTEL